MALTLSAENASPGTTVVEAKQARRHFPEYCELFEVDEDGFFLRKNPIRRMDLVYSFPENALATGRVKQAVGDG